MKNPGRLALAATVLALAAIHQGIEAKAAGGPLEPANSAYRVLAPIESGNLLLFPVVRDGVKASGETPFITLDEGFKSGEVEVTEAGKVRGLVRPREPIGTHPRQPGYEDRTDQVNTLVLVNRSQRPLLMLAGEIVTGGKQDRVIAKDRIVLPNADPIDLSVFCIEPGRWTESSPTFGAAGKAPANGSPANGFMAQPAVREKAMVAKDQQQVWNSVHGAITEMAVVTAAVPSSNETVTVNGESLAASGGAIGTTSYAKAMQNRAVEEKVDEAAAPVIKAREQVLEQLRQQHAVGVVVAIRGEIVWADLFASTDLLSRYWVKLVRSYAAESLTEVERHGTPTLAEAQHFLDAPSSGTESSEGDVGVYRYRELHTGGTETFVLESLLPGAAYDVHISKMKLKGEEHRPRPQPLFY